MLARPLARSLANPLARQLVAAPIGLDHATLGYLGVIRATGVTVTSAQQNAIDAFIVAEKDASRWDSHKRLYLPIWGNAAANAICLKTCLSGTFVNSPTHGAGFVQGNGTTSYFNTGISPTTAGFTSTSAHMYALVFQADSRTDPRMMIGARNNNVPANGECSIYQGSTTVLSSLLGRVAAVPVVFLTVAARTGVIHANRNAAQGLILSHRRTTVARTTAATSTGEISTSNISAMAITEGASRNLFTNARLGAYGFGLGLPNNTSVDAFTSNLKTLWETCTGLTLP